MHYQKKEMETSIGVAQSTQIYVHMECPRMESLA